MVSKEEKMPQRRGQRSPQANGCGIESNQTSLEQNGRLWKRFHQENEIGRLSNTLKHIARLYNCDRYAGKEK